LKHAFLARVTATLAGAQTATLAPFGNDQTHRSHRIGGHHDGVESQPPFHFRGFDASFEKSDADLRSPKIAARANHPTIYIFVKKISFPSANFVITERKKRHSRLGSEGECRW